MTKQELKDIISDIIKSNGSGSITGDVLREKLIQIIDFDLPTQLLNSSVVESFNDLTGDELIIFIKDDDVIKLSLDNFLDLIDSSGGGSNSNFVFSVPTEELVSDYIGKLVGLKDDKAVLIGIEGQQIGSVGKWRISVNSLPPAPVSRKIRIDFTNINFSEFTYGGIYLLYNNNNSTLQKNFVSVVISPSNEILIGDTLSDTIDNLMNFINSSLIFNYSSAERTDLYYLDIDLCDPTLAPQFFSEWESKMMTIEGFSMLNPSTTIIRGEDYGFLDHPQILSDENHNLDIYLGDFQYSYNAILQSFVDGYNYSDPLYNYYYMPLDLQSYLQQILAIVQQYYSVEDIQSDSFVIVGQIGTYTLTAPSDTVTLIETQEPIMASDGYINSSFLGELLDISNGEAIINPSETFKVVGEEEIVVGDFLTVNINSITGTVIKLPNRKEGSYYLVETLAENGMPVFVAITNGMEPYVKLFDTQFYLHFASSTSSSNSYSSGGDNRTPPTPPTPPTPVTCAFFLGDPSTNSYLQFYNNIDNYQQITVDSDVEGFLTGTLFTNWSYTIDTNDNDKLHVLNATQKGDFGPFVPTDSIYTTAGFYTNSDNDLLIYVSNDGGITYDYQNIISHFFV